MRAGCRGQGQTAVSVQHGGQALGQLRLSVVRGKQGTVAVAVDVDEARRQIPAPGVDGMDGGGTGQRPHSGDAAAGDRHVAEKGVGAVQDAGVLDQIIVQKGHLFSVLSV